MSNQEFRHCKILFLRAEELPKRILQRGRTAKHDELYYVEKVLFFGRVGVTGSSVTLWLSFALPWTSLCKLRSGCK